MVKLLPCPWCQKIPETRYIPSGGGSMFFTVRCTNFDCSIQPETTEFDTPQAAGKVWNRRTPAAAPERDGGSSE